MPATPSSVPSRLDFDATAPCGLKVGYIEKWMRESRSGRMAQCDVLCNQTRSQGRGFTGIPGGRRNQDAGGDAFGETATRSEHT